MNRSKHTGFAGALENYRMLLELIRELGPAYNPAKENLKLSSLELLYNEAHKALKDADSRAIEFDRCVSLRKDELNSLSLFATSLLREARVCGISGDILQNLKSALRQIRGIKASKSHVVSPSEPNETSEAKSTGIHYTMDRKFDAFKLMVNILEQTPEYESNLEGYSITQLKERVNTIRKLQDSYYEKLIELEVCRAKRNRLIQENLVSTSYHGKLVKDFLKNQFRQSKSDLNRLKMFQFKVSS